MAPDTGPNESANQNDEYLMNNAPPYNFPDSSSDEDDLDEEGDYIGNDVDSDGGDNMAGYQLLNQEGGEDSGGDRIGREDGEDNLSSEDNIYENNHQHSIQDTHYTNPTNLISSIADLPPAPVDEIINQLESIPRSDIELDEVKIDQIKQAMSRFSLPSSSIPGWASVVTEDQLANFIHCKTKPDLSH